MEAVSASPRAFEAIGSSLFYPTCVFAQVPMYEPLRIVRQQKQTVSVMNEGRTTELSQARERSHAPSFQQSSAF
eukprot:5375994-Pleurochrysis_carterae.AAC.1